MPSKFCAYLLKVERSNVVVLKTYNIKFDKC